MIEMTVAGVRIEFPSNSPIVLLREAEGERFLPIWIGQSEAQAIAIGQQGLVTPRPMTHDLLKNILEEMAVQVTSITITELRDGVFHAVIGLQRNGSSFEISSRPVGRHRAGRAPELQDLRERRRPRGGVDPHPRRRRGGGEAATGVPGVPGERDPRGLRVAPRG
jgi:hypothetical protein